MFEAASQAGIFLSKFQRSTYNVDHLKGQPYWTPDELGLTVKEKVLQKYTFHYTKFQQNFENLEPIRTGWSRHGF